MRIADFYKGRSIFVTGSTGFMGKILVEKLLHACPDINTIYLLVRPLKGMDIQCRLQGLVQNQVFDSLRKERPEALKKLVAVSGDITVDKLGLSASDKQILIDNVSVVFHSAARVRFDFDLRTAIEMNITGLQRVANLCREIKNLDVLLHVSTVYMHLDKKEIEEHIYPTSVDPVKLVEFLAPMSDEQLNGITRKLVGNSPNVYGFTKGLAEKLLQNEYGDLPVCIVRPSIVTATSKEPLPGWVDNLNGPTGLISGVGKGLLRALKVNPDLVGDLIPVEFPINLMIVAACYRAIKPTNTITVYNCSSGCQNPVTWGEIRTHSMAAWAKYPTSGLLWYPACNYNINPVIHKLQVAVMHYFPAYLYDTMARLLGKKPMLVRLYGKAHHAMACLEFYTTHQWNFVSRNPGRLMEKLCSQDRQVFNFDVRTIDWKSYLETYVCGVRQFILKDPPSTLPAARSKLNKMFWIMMLFRLILLRVGVFFASSFFLKLRRRYAHVPC